MPFLVLTASAIALLLLMSGRHTVSPPPTPAAAISPESTPNLKPSVKIDPNGLVDAFGPTVANEVKPSGPAPHGMVWIPGGEFSVGSNVDSESLCSWPGVTRDAAPIHRVYVDPFWIDATEVTNRQFEGFVKATAYVTVAETKPTQAEFPAAPPEDLIAGSTVFAPTTEPVSLND